MQTDTTQNPQLQFSIPIKICDGLFLSDYHIAQDIDFFQTNLITHVINCAGQQIPNSKSISQNKNFEISYLTFDWSENVIQNITEQKVISVLVGFIEECRKQSGCLLIHYASSESRPFCLLACYCMVKYKWSLFKTLEFLNSRKQEVQLEPAFFQQLTGFAQKLQDKGLIRSKTWVVIPGMTDQQIIITNTYLNSKNRHNTHQQNINRKKKQRNKVVWKKDIVTEHAYCPNSVIVQRKVANVGSIKKKNQPSMRTSVEKGESHKSYEKDKGQHPHNNRQNSIQKKNQDLNVLRNSLICENRERSTSTASMNETNVTRKWAQLRQMWLKEKQNQNNENSHTEVSRKQQQPQYIMKKENQKVNDRLQDKLNMLKKHELKYQNNTSQNKQKESHKQFFEKDTHKEKNHQEGQALRKDKTKGSQVLQEKSQNTLSHSKKNLNSKDANESRNQRASSLNNKENRDSQSGGINSRIIHNNWIIDNQTISDHKKITNKGSNKSVIIIKPNHASQHNGLTNTGQSNQASRSSLRKNTASQRKQDKNKDNSVKFFRNQAAQILGTKGRCNSAKPQRKQGTMNCIGMSGVNLSKNGSLRNKGKWKF